MGPLRPREVLNSAKAELTIIVMAKRQSFDNLFNESKIYIPPSIYLMASP